ncbi:MAG: hypothetical protein IT379_37440, partial [Deltaproteobacteria bacterium]|nr:hypothetical protein [Deltaproteobacteria bacterium]
MDRAETRPSLVPPAPGRSVRSVGRAARRRGHALGRVGRWLLFAGVLLVGSPVLLLVLLVRTEAGKREIKRFAVDAIRDELGLVARVGDVQLDLVPLEVRITNVVLDDPVYGRLGRVRHLALRPSVFAIVTGEDRVLESIEAEDGSVRLVVRNGELVNMPRPRKPSSGGEIPFADLAAAGVRVEVDFAPHGRAVLEDVDLDVVAAPGGAMDLRALCLRAHVRHPGGSDDVRRIEVRGRVSPSAIAVHQLVVESQPLSLRVERARVALPFAGIYRGRVTVNGDLSRVNTLTLPFERPPLSGRVSVVAEVQGRSDGPYAQGRVLLDDVVVKQFGVGDRADIVFDANPRRITTRGTVQIVKDGGRVELEAEVGLGAGFPIEASLIPRDLQFAKLLDQLGVSENAIIQWTLSGSIRLRGTADPLRLEGPIEVDTRDMLVTRGPYHHPRGRIIGVPRATLRGRTRVTPGAVEFLDVRGAFGRSTIGGDIRLGTDNTVRVHIESQHLDVADGSPLMDFQVAGAGRVVVDVGGRYQDPSLDVRFALDDFAFDTFGFGNIQGRAELHGLRVVFPRTDAVKRDSRYHVTDGYLDFENDRFAAGGLVHAHDIWLRDVFHMFHYENDERYDDYDGRLNGQADIRYTRSFPGDGPNGTMRMAFGGDLADTTILEERFASGRVDGTWHWFDWVQGYRGGELRLARLELRKGTGTITAEGTMRRGDLDMHAVADRIALAELDKVRAREAPIEGTAAVLATIRGTLALPRVDMDLNLTGVRVMDTDVGDARAYVRLTDADDPYVTSALQPPTGDPERDACRRARRGLARHGWPEDPPLRTRDGPVRALDRPQAWIVCGQTLDGRVLADLALGRTEDYPIRGRITIDRMSLDPWLPRRPGTEPLTGLVSGTATFTRGALFEPETIGGEIELDALHVAQGALSLANVGVVRVGIERGRFRVAQARFAGTSTQLELSGGGTIRGDLSLDVNGEIDLAFLSGLSPSLEESWGRVQLSADVAGSITDPSFYGSARVRDAGLRVRDYEHAITGLRGDVTFSARRAVLEGFRADFAGGELSARGFLEIQGGGLHAYDLEIGAREVSLELAEQVPISFGAEGRLTWTEGERLPTLRGDLHVARLSYGRSIDLGETLTDLGRSARRVEVDDYDPAEDHVALDV